MRGLPHNALHTQRCQSLLFAFGVDLADGRFLREFRRLRQRPASIMNLRSHVDLRVL
jgi:hypothetical protein